MTVNVQKPIGVSVLEHALNSEDITVLYLNNTAISASELAERSVNVAQLLANQEMPTGTLALCEHNSLDFIAVFLGANLLGLNVQVFNPDWPRSLIEATRDYLEPDIFVACDEICRDCVDISLGNLPKNKKTKNDIQHWIKLGKRNSNTADAFYTGFTSGSTGLPKGFMRSEKSWLNSFDMDRIQFGLTQRDNLFCLGNFTHSLFFYALLRGLYAGIPVIAASQFRPAHILKTLAANSSAVIFSVPTQLQTLVDQCRQKQVLLPGVRLVLSAGAKLQNELRLSVKQLFPAAEIAEFYGSSELGYISLARDKEEIPFDSVGRAVPGAEIRILDETLQPVKSKEVGQIYVKSPYGFLGYAGPRGCIERSKILTSEDFIGCGDTGYLDETDCLYISGRSDRMMLIAGRNSFPENIEAILSRHECVHRVAVFPEKDPLRGERPVAVIEPCSGANISRKSLMLFARSFLPEYEIPRKYYLQASWPFTASHKTDLQKLHQQLRSQKLETLA